MPLFGCVSYSDKTRMMRNEYQSRRYPAALEQLEQTDLDKEGRRSVLYKLEKAMIADRMGKPQEARALLKEADKISDDLYTKSVSKTSASFLVNDAVADYQLEDFEQIAIHAQLALSFLEDDELQSARVAARKINSKLQEINQRYRDEKEPRYGQDAFGLYLSGLIYEAKGDWDDAIIDYGKAYGLFKNKYSWFVPEIPTQLVESYYRMLAKRRRTSKMREVEKDYPKIVEEFNNQQNLRRNYGSLVTLFEIRTIANKESASHILPVSGQVIRFSFPRIPYTSDRVGRTGFEVIDDKEQASFYPGEMVQNLNKIAYYTLEERRARTTLKATSRLIVKGVAVDAARRKYGALGGILANALSVATETADTRGWNLLPAYYFAARAELPAGTYKIRMIRDGEPSEAQEVKIKPRHISFLRSKS